MPQKKTKGIPVAEDGVRTGVEFGCQMSGEKSSQEFSQTHRGSIMNRLCGVAELSNVLLRIAGSCTLQTANKRQPQQV
jgi:hypothetical protein